MPRYYCDYCDTYLTHDSPVVRKQHNTGYKHKANVKNYYMQFEEAQTQDLIDNKIMEHLARAAGGEAAVIAGPMPGNSAADATLAALRPPSQNMFAMPGSMPGPGMMPAMGMRPGAMPGPQFAGYRPPQVLQPPAGFRPPVQLQPPGQMAAPYQR